MNCLIEQEDYGSMSKELVREDTLAGVPCAKPECSKISCRNI
jgi:hypothetical protein